MEAESPKSAGSRLENQEERVGVSVWVWRQEKKSMSELTALRQEVCVC